MKHSKSLIKTILSSGGKKIISDLTEITLEAVTESEIIDKIPIVGWLRKFYMIGHSINDSYFILKLLKFLKELQSIPESEKNEFLSKMKSDEKYEDKVGDKLIELLIHMDDAEKAKIIARLFAAYIDGRIGYDSFCRYAQVVNNSYLKDLERISKSKLPIDEDDNLVKISSSDVMILLNSGLVDIRSKSMPSTFSKAGALTANNIIEYSLNDAGLEFFELIKEKKQNPPLQAG